ncbi:F-box family-6 [Striga asiatica]|uniref:F-box family-6 n=1 Tax=Striga asiatica TaxID=4170 RepID=A0A5A7P1F8_STRAF|nr:F-box family-6 [Striga asiatica]
MRQMDVGTSSWQQHKADDPNTRNRKRKRKHKESGNTCMQGVDNDVGFNKLPDDIIITILSRLSPKEAARSSLLSRRWRYLWFCSSGILHFDDRKMFSHDLQMLKLKSDFYEEIDVREIRDIHKKIVARKQFLFRKFVAWVTRVLKLHQCLTLDGLIIHFSTSRDKSPFGRRSGYIDSWIYSAMRKEIKMLELNFPGYHYEFPNLELLLSYSPQKFGFGLLRTLRLEGVDVEDKVVRHFLASCHYLECLCTRKSDATKRLRFVDPLPSLKVLEISDCYFIRKLEVSATSIVSCTYNGLDTVFPFEKALNLSELTLGREFAEFFIYEPSQHTSYSAQLEKLTLNIHETGFRCPQESGLPPPDLSKLCSLKHLELNVMSTIKSIYFFISLIKAAPLLTEFRMKITYVRKGQLYLNGEFPEVLPEFHRYRCRHKNLKTVKISGFIGCSYDNMFVCQLLKLAKNLETITIDTESEYYRKEKPCKCAANNSLKEKCVCVLLKRRKKWTQAKAIKRAQRLKSRYSGKAVFIVT